MPQGREGTSYQSRIIWAVWTSYFSSAFGRFRGLIGAVMNNGLSLSDVQALYATLSSSQREEVLECLLIASTEGGDAMVRVIRELVLCHAAEDLTGAAD